jgi:hypothetical protein
VIANPIPIAIDEQPAKGLVRVTIDEAWCDISDDLLAARPGLLDHPDVIATLQVAGDRHTGRFDLRISRDADGLIIEGVGAPGPDGVSEVFHRRRFRPVTPAEPS